MFEAYCRPHFQSRVIDPIAKCLIRARLTPTQLTALSLLAGLGVLGALLLQHVFLALALLWCSGLFDVLDGSMARLLGASSASGAALDIFADRLVEASVIIGLFLMAPADRGLLCLLMLAGSYLCVTSFLLVGVFSSNYTEKSFHYSPGLMERLEAFILFSLMIGLPSLFNVISITYSVLVFYTALRRILEFCRQV